MSGERDLAPDLSVPALEAGVIRVFALDGGDPALAAILPPHPLDAGHLAPLLGVAALREGDAERIALRDLGDYTLSEFLRIGHDIRSEELAPVAAELDALTGHVILLHSAAFAGQAASLTLHPGLRLVASLNRRAAPATPLSLPAAERPEILTPVPAAATKGKGGFWLAAVILGLIAMGALLFWARQ